RTPRYCACATVRGNPSNTNPCEQSGRSMRSRTIFRTRESGTRSPRAMMGLASNPSGVPWLTCSRSMSPVERCGTPYFLANSFACVPFPAPGGPRKITARSNFCGARVSGATQASPLPPTAQPALSCKAFVVPHDQLSFQLLHRIHGHAHDDQERRSAEIEIDSQAFQEPGREMTVKPGADPQAQMVQMDAGDQPFRQHANRRQVNGADKRQPLQD